MAIWQYGFHLVPKDVLPNHPPVLSPSDRDAVISRVDAGILESAAQAFDKHLKRAKSWHSQISAWGDQAGDHIEVSRLSDGVGSIRVRIDVRDIDQSFLGRVVETAVHLDCLFVTEDNHVAPAKAAKLLAVLRGSPAHKFVEDPEAYFREIAESESDEESGLTTSHE